jgi:hypothetical protein
MVTAVTVVTSVTVITVATVTLATVTMATAVTVVTVGLGPLPKCPLEGGCLVCTAGLRAAAKLMVLRLFDIVYHRSVDLLTAFRNYFQSVCVLEKRCIVCYLPFKLLRERESGKEREEEREGRKREE